MFKFRKIIDYKQNVTSLERLEITSSEKRLLMSSEVTSENYFLHVQIVMRKNMIFDKIKLKFP